jgi:hypothetical protein
MLNAVAILSEKHDCRDICCGLASVLNDDFDSIEKILDTKSRLFSLVYGSEGSEDDSYRQVDEFQ